MGFLKLLGVPEGMTAAEARQLQRLEAHGVARDTPSTSAPDTGAAAAQLDDEETIAVTD